MENARTPPQPSGLACPDPLTSTSLRTGPASRANAKQNVPSTPATFPILHGRESVLTPSVTRIQPAAAQDIPQCPLTLTAPSPLHVPQDSDPDSLTALHALLPPGLCACYVGLKSSLLSYLTRPPSCTSFLPRSPPGSLDHVSPQHSILPVSRTSHLVCTPTRTGLALSPLPRHTSMVPARVAHTACQCCG